MSPPRVNRKGTWMVVWAAFTAAPVVYLVIGTQVAGQVAPSTSLPLLRAVFMTLASTALLAGAFLLTRVPRARADAQGLAALFGSDTLAEPVVFQQAFIVTTAMVESCSLYGFILVFLGAPVAEYLPFGAGTVAVMLGVALPTGLRYWSERERLDLGSAEPIE
jgi:hypothetical protein